MARKPHSNKRNLSRQREENAKILIVTEDSKSAYNYFQMLKAEIRLPMLGVEVEPSKKSAPDQVVLFTEKRAKEIGAELSFCVIDRDTHENFDKAISDARKSKTLRIIASYPCFEYWILLHHEKDCYKTMSQKECQNENNLLFPNYRKSMSRNEWKDFYKKHLEISLSTAIEKSLIAEKRCNENGTKNPKTDIYKLFKDKNYPFYNKSI